MAENQKRIKISDFFSSQGSTILSKWVALSIQDSESDGDENPADSPTIPDDISNDDDIKPNQPVDITVIPHKITKNFPWLHYLPKLQRVVCFVCSKAEQLKIIEECWEN